MVKQANFTEYLYRWVNVTGYVEMVTAIKLISNSHIAGAEAHVNVSDSDRQQELNPVNMAQTRGRGGPMDKVILPQTTSPHQHQRLQCPVTRWRQSSGQGISSWREPVCHAGSCKNRPALRPWSPAAVILVPHPC